MYNLSYLEIQSSPRPGRYEPHAKHVPKHPQDEINESDETQKSVYGGA
jgi:hypothetical protein